MFLVILDDTRGRAAHRGPPAELGRDEQPGADELPPAKLHQEGPHLCYLDASLTRFLFASQLGFAFRHDSHYPRR